MSNIDYAALNETFGLLGQVTFKPGPGGLPAVEVRNPQASATLLLQGAHIIDWTPIGAEPVIWLSKDAKFVQGKSVRGGVPVCWPWFGPHATESSFPAHGFARTVDWEVIGTRALPDGETWLALRMVPTDATRAQWPHACEAVLQIVVGRSLDIDLATRNTGKKAITIGDALHTYFAVGDVSKIAIHGLDGAPYLDKVDGGKQKQQAGPISIYQEVDRIYLNTANDCVIEDPVMQRRIRVAKQNSHSTVVWNPWIEKANKMGDLGPNGHLDMVCVESTNAADDVVTLKPGAEHHLWARYSVEAL